MPLKTSSSKLGVYSLGADPLENGPGLACMGVFIDAISVPNASPHFDYNITDIFFRDDKVFIANPYSEYVFKDALGNSPSGK